MPSGSGIPFYGNRRTRFLYVVTNTLRDGVAARGFWDTTELPPGDYILRIWAADINGNVATANRDLPVTHSTAMSSIPTDVKQAIHAGDADRLRESAGGRSCPAPMPSSAGAGTIASRRIRSTTSATRFSRASSTGRRRSPLVDALLAAGAKVDFHEPGKGETPLMGAA